MKAFLVCALEPSANLHLREVLKVYKREFGEFELWGIYDEALCEEFAPSSRPLYSAHEFSAMGFVEVLPLIFKAKKAIKELTRLSLERERAGEGFAAALCIDSPAFNLPLAKAFKKAGVKMKKIYYILPQVWAWKRGRVRVIEECFDILASILPFDAQFFTKSTYVGHPLLDELHAFKTPMQWEESLKKSPKEKIIAFLPGSRAGEIKRLMPIFRELAGKFAGEKILCVPPFKQNALEIYGDLSGFKVQSGTEAVLERADFAFICSGTATLEAALLGTPFILAYKARAVDVFIARRFVKLKHIGLANIFCDFAKKGAMNPEFLQDEVRAKALFEAYEKYDYKGFFAKVGFLKEYLGFGSAKKLAQILNKI